MNDQVDVPAVLATEAAYDTAWNAGDIDGLVACFADDAVLVNPRGEIAVGAQQIRERLGAFLHGDAKGSRHASRAVRVSFVSPDVAVCLRARGEHSALHSWDSSRLEALQFEHSRGGRGTGRVRGALR
jgi:uncharacterized protein (TIGR02246 family)